MSKIIFTTMILSIIFTSSSARVLSKQNKQNNKSSASSSSQSSMKSNEYKITNFNQKIDKDEDRIQFKDISMPTSQNSLENKTNLISQAVMKQLDDKNNLKPQTFVINNQHVVTANSFDKSFEEMSSKKNKSVVSDLQESQSNHQIVVVQSPKVNQVIIRHDLLNKKGSHSIDEDVHSVSNQSVDHKKLVSAAIQMKLNNMKQGVKDGSIVLNQDIEQVRSSQSSSLVTNSHATHSHATNEPCNRKNQEQESNSSSLKTDSHASHSHKSNEPCTRLKKAEKSENSSEDIDSHASHSHASHEPCNRKNKSNNSEVEEEVVIRTNSQVLEDQENSSELQSVQDSRVSMDNSVKAFSALLGMVALMLFA